MKPLHEKVIFKEGTSFLSFRRPQIEYEFNWHIHPEFEIVYILKGHGTRYVGNSVEEYSAPELVFIPPGIPHSWQSDPKSMDNDAYVLHFQKDCFGEEWYQQNEFKALKQVINSKSALLINEGREGADLFEKTIKTSGLKKISAFIELLDLIIRSESKQLGEFGSSETAQLNPKLDKILAWVHEHFREEFTVNSLAEKMSMSLYQLRSAFKISMNKSVLQYTNELRVFEACRLMQNRQFTISYLSTLAGFNNLSYFNRIFLKVTGLTPREYRKVFCG